MRNVTFSADEELIDRARLRARVEKKTLNAVFANGFGGMPAIRRRRRTINS